MIIGSEVHIDMYDDRLEIVSPGGMYDGRKIQEIDINDVASIRRNPVFSRLDYMERRGSGLRRIKEAYIDQSLVQFRSNEHNFFVILRKQYYDENKKIHDKMQKVHDEGEEIHDEMQKVYDEKVILKNLTNQFTAYKIQNKTLHNIVTLFSIYGEEKTFGRQHIAKELNMSVDRAAKMLFQMVSAGVIEKAEGKGKYKFIKDWSRQL